MTSWSGAMIRRTRLPGAQQPLGMIDPETYGTRNANRNKVEVTCRFDPDQFAEIVDFANSREVSFPEAVRLLVEWGLEAEHG